MPLHAPRRPARTLAFLPLAIAALSAVLVVQTVGRDPRLLLPMAALALMLFAPAALGRRRMRRLLLSGDVERVIGTWAGSVGGQADRGAVDPLLRATAYASYGWVEAARRALGRAVAGPGWEAAFEQRLFVETLLDTFEGEREVAMRKAQALERLPMPPTGIFARRRIELLRRGLAALTRAFAHASRAGDAALLSRAARASPLVHWAMRYAQAVVAVDQGRPREVEALLANAPCWPEDSAFRTYHAELMGRVGAAAV